MSVSVRSVRPFKSKYNKFNLSHSFDLSFKMGYAIPVLVQNFFPGDSFRISWEQLSRMVPLNSPAFSKVRVRFDAFRCDQHQVWPNFEEFMKQTESGAENTIVYPYKTVPSGGFAKGSLSDYLGMAIGTGVGCKVDATIYRHYANIINEYYINSNIQNKIEFSKGDGEDVTTPMTLRKVNYREDRFVGAETTTQRGSSTILPIGNGAPVYTGVENSNLPKAPLYVRDVDGNLPATGYNLTTASNGKVEFGAGSQSTTGTGVVPSNLYADMRNVTGVDINLLNTMEQINRYKVLSLLAGEHYPDWQEVMYGVRSSDARLQIPQWLGSYKAPFVISEVLQTSQTTESSPQGTMAGHGFSKSQAGLYIPRLNSFGYIIILMFVMPTVIYDQGLPKMYNRFDPYDFPNPLFARMPLQGIKKSELYWQDASVVNTAGTPVNDDNWAYSPIYDEERYRLNRVAGDFHDTLASMIVRRHFNSIPAFNESFIQAEDNLASELFAVSPAIQDPLYAHIDFNIVALRKLPRVGLPSFL